MINKANRIFYTLILTLLSAVICYQTYLTTNDYMRQLRLPIWRLRHDSSFNRSAVFFLSSEGTDFLGFINSIIPPAVKVILPEQSGPFSEQNILQFFMLDKTIMVCPSGAARIECLSNPDKYLIATTAYPPHESDIDKVFIPYPDADPNYPYEGVYVPRDYQEGVYSAFYPSSYNILLILVCDVGVLLAWLLLGWLIITAIFREAFHPVAPIISFPIGMGVYTWAVFVVSVLGAPLTIWTIFITYMGLLFGVTLIVWRSNLKLQLPKVDLAKGLIILKQIRPSPIVLGIFLLSAFLLLTLLYIGVGRGYSTFDDMAIWSLKGYYMAFKQDLFAAVEASGHGLSYPLNLSLAISTFYLIDQDLLPGSKIAYFLLFLSMLTCIYWFLRENKIPRALTSLSILLIISTPVIYRHATYGFANIPFACYIVIGFLISVMGAINHKSALLYSGGLVLSLAGWTRPEGIGFVLVLACIITALATYRHLKFQQLLIFFLITLSLSGTWIIMGYRYFRGDEIGGAVSGLLRAFSSGTFSWASVWTTVSYSWERYTSASDWGYVIPVTLLLIIIMAPAMIRRISLVPIAILVACLLTYLLPLGMFVAKFHQNTGSYLEFLSVSFDRAQFPTIIFLIITMALFLGCSFFSPLKEPKIPVE